MINYKQILNTTKKEEKEAVQDFYYVDDCNQCKLFLEPEPTPCTHSWFCHQDKGEVQDLMFKLQVLNDFKRRWGFLPAKEKEEKKELLKKKQKLILKGLKEDRK